ncbi:hypothetical protein V6N11_053724 [Hibiscus sabdariffa]|uniref:non-specific serine/threonine protein kinase n=1 Tax=Hibiscus sabdariffa TaxID=183260 RepID=A0ABR2S1S6_9ROSI
MPRGSLFYVFIDDTKTAKLDWIKRVKVIKDTTSALSYLHHDCHSPIVHRDILSNNILLNSDFEARVSDFGTARLLDPNSSIQIACCYLQIHCTRSNPKFRLTMKRASHAFLCQKETLPTVSKLSLVQLKNLDLYMEGDASEIQFENAVQDQDGETLGHTNFACHEFHHLDVGLHSLIEFRLLHPLYTDHGS